MQLQGKLIAETPVYRGNARKTLFTRDGDGTQRLVSLAGEIKGTAESLMDAFIGVSKRRNNVGLLNELWLRLYGEVLPQGLIRNVRCTLNKECYPKERLFDLRMGLKLDEDRWAAEAGSNYKLETLFRNSAFDYSMEVDPALLAKNENEAKLYYLLEELRQGRFWFGAGKSKGLGRCRLELDPGFTPKGVPSTNTQEVNHLRLNFQISAKNPLLVNWPWGKVEETESGFVPLEGSLLLSGLLQLPREIRDRLGLGLAGPVSDVEAWKEKLKQAFPRVVSTWLLERCKGEESAWVLPSKKTAKLGKGKHPISKKILQNLEPITDQPYTSQEELEKAILEALGNKDKMLNRFRNILEKEQSTVIKPDPEVWRELTSEFDLGPELENRFANEVQNEQQLSAVVEQASVKMFEQLLPILDRQLRLIQSDGWVDQELRQREIHLRIKQMLLEGRITADQWEDAHHPPKDISLPDWQEFLKGHAKVRYNHITNGPNLRKAIANDENHLAFLKNFRNKSRQELTRTGNIDFRAGGAKNRHISRKYGKHYDNLFIRMLSWSPSQSEEAGWEVYIPGSSIKGAFRKRASQILKTLESDQGAVSATLNTLFGSQGKRGLVFFSDAYLQDRDHPERAWCSMDAVKIDHQTGRPIEGSKRDYLYAYGQDLSFNLQMDLQDVTPEIEAALDLFLHLIDDFRRGEIPIGGQKTSGFGWVQGEISGLEYRTLQQEDPFVRHKVLGGQDLEQSGLWWEKNVSGEEAGALIQPGQGLAIQGKRDKATEEVPRKQNFVSHRAFGGLCGLLTLKADVLSPLHVQESGEPTYSRMYDTDPVNGWDFFSYNSPEADKRGDQRLYVLPSKSLKGMVRSVYAMACGEKESGKTIDKLSAVDSLFGWVGTGPNQALAGRLAFGMAEFNDPKLSWMKLPYPYGDWAFEKGQWVQKEQRSAKSVLIDQKWRVFPHLPLAPCVKPLDSFEVDTAQAFYFRAIQPGSSARVQIRFWNLTQEEFKRFLWCLLLEQGLAHKLGSYRYLGLGSLKLNLIQEESYLTDWWRRYVQREEEWKRELNPVDWLEAQVICNHKDLKEALYADHL